MATFIYLYICVVSLMLLTLDNHVFAWCPAITDGCYCRKKYIVEDYLYCENLGNVRTIPKFNSSETVFLDVQFRYNTTIDILQKNAFCGVKAISLHLQQLGINDIHRQAFHCLKDTLTHLHLDGNHLTNLPKDSLLSVSQLQFLGLHNNMLETLPIMASSNEQFEHLTYLYLFNNRISNIPIRAFRGMSALKGLKLNNNLLTTIHRGIFDTLVELKDLELQGNRLGTLPGNIFQYLNKLSKLDLSHNMIYTLLTEAFKGLGQLETLYLNNNMLSEFQSGMFRYVSRVKYLKLSRNYASSILDSTFRGLSYLRVVDLSFNRITSIEPKAFRYLYRLEKLQLRGNQLRHLDFLQLSFLGKLKSLDMSSNNLTHLLDPRVFHSVSKLEQLDLSGNSLGNLSPGIFSHLRLMKNLKAKDNPLFVLREGVLDHPALEELDLRNCRLRFIHDKAFTSIGNIKYMWLDDNEMERIPERLFNNTNNMEILSFENNSLSYLKRGMFKGLESLKSLHLDRNKLNNISEYSLVFLGGLTQLTVSHNNISELYEHSFNDLKMLKILDVSYNAISSLQRAFSRFQYIEEINLSGNNLQNANWFNFYYNTLENLKMLDLSNCNIEVSYLDGLLFTLKNPQNFQLDLSRNPLICSGCDLAWISAIPLNNLLNPGNVRCRETANMYGKPVLCTIDRSCLTNDLTNDTQLSKMCRDAEDSSFIPIYPQFNSSKTTTLHSPETTIQIPLTSATTTSSSTILKSVTTPFQSASLMPINETFSTSTHSSGDFEEDPGVKENEQNSGSGEIEQDELITNTTASGDTQLSKSDDAIDSMIDTTITKNSSHLAYLYTTITPSTNHITATANKGRIDNMDSQTSSSSSKERKQTFPSQTTYMFQSYDSKGSGSGMIDPPFKTQIQDYKTFEESSGESSGEILNDLYDWKKQSGNKDDLLEIERLLTSEHLTAYNSPQIEENDRVIAPSLGAQEFNEEEHSSDQRPDDRMTTILDSKEYLLHNDSYIYSGSMSGSGSELDHL